MPANAMQGIKIAVWPQLGTTISPSYFEREQLRAVLRRWLPKQHDTNSQQRASAVEPSHANKQGGPDNNVLDHATLKDILSLQKTGGQDILKKLVGLYLESAPKLISELQSGIHQQNTAIVKNAAHTLKSNSAKLWRPQAIGPCKDVKASVLIAEDIGRLNTRFELIKNEYEQARAALLRVSERL